MKYLLLSLLLIFNINVAYSHDDKEQFADWFNSLTRPDMHNVKCCGTYDAFYTDNYEPTIDGFKAKVDNQWIDIPINKVIWDKVNPTGRGVVFMSKSEFGGMPYIYCFIMGSGT